MVILSFSLCVRSIRCLRNIIHWNLISAFILRNVTWFIVQLTMNPDVHESNVVRYKRPKHVRVLSKSYLTYSVITQCTAGVSWCKSYLYFIFIYYLAPADQGTLESADA